MFGTLNNQLSLKYGAYLNSEEFTSEIASIKHQISALIEDVNTASPLDLLNFIHKRALDDVYPNIEIALHSYLTIPVTSASCERSLSKLKLIKSYIYAIYNGTRATRIVWPFYR